MISKTSVLVISATISDLTELRTDSCPGAFHAGMGEHQVEVAEDPAKFTLFLQVCSGPPHLEV